MRWWVAKYVFTAAGKIGPLLPQGAELRELRNLGAMIVILPASAGIEEFQGKIRSACTDVVGFSDDAEIETLAITASQFPPSCNVYDGLTEEQINTVEACADRHRSARPAGNFD